MSDKNGTTRLRGRPTKLTTEISASIVSDMARGYFLETAAYHAGVSPRTVFKWMERGKRTPGQGLYGRFYSGVKKGLAVAETRLHEGIARAGRRHWTALAWLLERRFPKKYGRKEVVRIEAGGKDTNEMTMEQLERWIARVEAAEMAKLESGESTAPGG